MKAIYNGIIVTEKDELKGKAILFDRNIIDICDEADIPKSAELIDAKGGYVLPGLIDLHIHGQIGLEVSFATLSELEQMSRHLLQFGVTAWCPTTATLSIEQLEKAFNVIREAKQMTAQGEWNGASVLGVNSEGPFINYEKRGAQAPQYIIKPDAQFIIDNSDIVKLVTIAPEVEGGIEFIKEITEKTDVVASLGHSSADYETAVKGIKAGATHATHTFNAMPPLNHRDPGLVGAVLTHDNVYCELIADTVHVNPALYELVARQKGERLVLITDNITPAGLPDGEYSSGALDVKLQGLRCTLSDGTIAGSVYHFNTAIRNFKEHTSLPLHEIVKAASLNPASAIGESETRGSLKIGKRADIIITDKDFNVKYSAILGEVCYNII